MSKLDSILEDFEQAIKRLAESLEQEKTEFIRDSVIKRFEFTFDLAWRTIKSYLEEEIKIKCNSPRSCIKEAYAQKLIDYDKFWLDLADLRNEAVHIYSEDRAEFIYGRMPEVLKKFKELHKNIKKDLEHDYPNQKLKKAFWRRKSH